MDSEEKEEVYRDWERKTAMYMEIIRYCDGYRGLYRTKEHIAKMRRTWGDPSPSLRQRAKNNLKAAYLEYWETI